MSGRFWLTGKQVERLRPQVPKARGKPRVDDRRVPSGILHVLRNGLRWQDAPTVYGPHKTLQSLRALVATGDLCPHLPRLGSLGLRRGHPHDGQHSPEGAPHSGEPQKRGLRPRAMGRTKGGLSSRLHMASDGHGRPLTFFLSPGQMSDAKGALVLLAEMPPGPRG